MSANAVNRAAAAAAAAVAEEMFLSISPLSVSCSLAPFSLPIHLPLFMSAE